MPNKPKALPDFHVHDHGSICILVPVSEAAQDWVAFNLPDNAMQWGGGVVIEPRYVSDIVEGAMADGLTVR